MKTFLALMVLFSVQMTVSAQVADPQTASGIPQGLEEMLAVKFETLDDKGKRDFVITCFPELEKILAEIEARSPASGKEVIQRLSPEVANYLKTATKFQQGTSNLEQLDREVRASLSEQKKLLQEAEASHRNIEASKDFLDETFFIVVVWSLVIFSWFILTSFIAIYVLVLRIAPSWVIFRKLRNVHLKIAGFKAANQEEWSHIQEILGLVMGHLKHASLYLNEVSKNANSGRFLKSICKSTNVVSGCLGKFGVKPVDPEFSLVSKAGIAISQEREELSQAKIALAKRENALEQTIKERVASLRADDAAALSILESKASENLELANELAQKELDLRAREVRLANDRLVVEQMLTDANRLNQEGQNMLLSVAGLSKRDEVAA